MSKYVVYWYDHLGDNFIRRSVVEAKNMIDAGKHLTNIHREATIVDIMRKPEGEVIKEDKKMSIDLTKKMSITLNEDDIKEIIADYVSQQICDKTRLTKENVSFEYGVREFGTQREPDRRPYIKECVIRR